MEQLKNEKLTIKVKEHGAELCSITDSKGKEYLWQADPAFWKRHSPVLFPIVGSVWNGEFKAEGKTYKMSQHGFARDTDFTLVSKTENEVWFALDSNNATIEAYPYRFRLEIGYHLEGNTIKVMWKVENKDNKEIFFQIGAHPAFYYPNYGEDGERGYFRFDIKDSFRYLKIGEKACASLVEHKQELDGHDLRLDIHTFDIDTFIVHDSQLKSVALLDKNKSPYLSLYFDAPVVGLWSPPTKNAPFVCIEPWYGRCDRENFTGEFRERDNVNALKQGETFSASYDIRIDAAE